MSFGRGGRDGRGGGGFGRGRGRGGFGGGRGRGGSFGRRDFDQGPPERVVGKLKTSEQVDWLKVANFTRRGWRIHAFL